MFGMALIDEDAVSQDTQRVFDITILLKNSLIDKVERVDKTGNYAGEIELFDKDSSPNQFSVSYGFHDSALGKYILGVRDSKICFLGFVADASRCSIVSELRKQFGVCTLRENKIETDKLAYLLTLSINEGVTFDEKISLFGTEFQIKVWNALLKIPKGRVVSYRTIAQMIGKPSASRAVANAIGRNPISLIIPCHRVVRSSGELGGYRWGIAIKTKILQSELEGSGNK